MHLDVFVMGKISFFFLKTEQNKKHSQVETNPR